jgi:hypothetical protein
MRIERTAIRELAYVGPSQLNSELADIRRQAGCQQRTVSRNIQRQLSLEVPC